MKPSMIEELDQEEQEEQETGTTENTEDLSKPAQYVATLKGVGNYTASQFVPNSMQNEEEFEAYEERIWRQKIPEDPKRGCFISGMAFKFALIAAAKRRGDKIGKGRRTYGKIFESAIMVEPLYFGIYRKDLHPIEGVDLKDDEDRNVSNMARVYVNADGVRGSGKRVFKIFPKLPEWGGKLTITVLDQTIKQEVLWDHLKTAGKYVGVGSYRMERGGENGRFEVLELKRVKMPGE